MQFDTLNSRCQDFSQVKSFAFTCFDRLKSFDFTLYERRLNLAFTDAGMNAWVLPYNTASTVTTKFFSKYCSWMWHISTVDLPGHSSTAGYIKRSYDLYRLKGPSYFTMLSIGPQLFGIPSTSWYSTPAISMLSCLPLLMAGGVVAHCLMA